MARNVKNKVSSSVAYLEGEPNKIEAIRISFNDIVNSETTYWQIAKTKGLVPNTLRNYFKGIRSIDVATVGFIGKVLSFNDGTEKEITALKKELEIILSSDSSTAIAKRTGATQQNIDLYIKGKVGIDNMTLAFAEKLLYGEQDKNE